LQTQLAKWLDTVVDNRRRHGSSALERFEKDRAAQQAFEDEVIDKLFVLNAERAEEEKKAAAAKAPVKAARKTAAKKEDAGHAEAPAEAPKRGRKKKDDKKDEGQGNLGF
jgi:hypothetical protein